MSIDYFKHPYFVWLKPGTGSREMIVYRGRQVFNVFKGDTKGYRLIYMSTNYMCGLPLTGVLHDSIEKCEAELANHPDSKTTVAVWIEDCGSWYRTNQDFLKHPTVKFLQNCLKDEE